MTVGATLEFPPPLPKSGNSRKEPRHQYDGVRGDKQGFASKHSPSSTFQDRLYPCPSLPDADPLSSSTELGYAANSGAWHKPRSSPSPRFTAEPKQCLSRRLRRLRPKAAISHNKLQWTSRRPRPLPPRQFPPRPLSSRHLQRRPPRA